MELFRQKAKPVSVFMTIFILPLAVPYQSVFAAMIGTETVIEGVYGRFFVHSIDQEIRFV